MTELALFTIGPVQRFIETARKAEDLWMGSYILSYLTGIAIQELTDHLKQMDRIIFPAIAGQPLIDWLTNPKLGRTKEKEAEFKEQLMLPTLPNRVLARGTYTVQHLQDVEHAIKKTFTTLAHTVCQQLLPNILPNDPKELETSQDFAAILFKRQITNFLEIYWVIMPESEPPNYQKDYAELERQLGGVKSCRRFEQRQEEGLKCSLCGEREVLHATQFPPEATIKEMKMQVEADWDKMWTTDQQLPRHKYLTANEYLCAVCLAKRGGELFFKHELELADQLRAGFPSTIEVATAAFKADMSQESAALAQYQELTAGLQAMTEQQIPLIRPLPKIRSQLSYKDNIEGEWLLEESFRQAAIRKLFFPEETHLPPQKATECFALKDKRKKFCDAQKKRLQQDQQLLLQKMVEATKNGVPPTESDIERLTHLQFARTPVKYYAVFVMDGDNMGQTTQAATDAPQHRRVSAALNDYTPCVQKIVEQVYLGKLLYAGGDDVMAFANLDHLFPMLRALHAAFPRQALADILKLPVSNFSVSAGVCVAHYKYPLGEALSWARQMERAAKAYPDDQKNAVGLAVIKHSGNVSKTVVKWQYGDLHTMKLAETTRQAFALWLSDTVLYTLRQEFFKLFASDLPLEGEPATLVYAELHRLLRRHTQKEPIAQAQMNNLAKQLTALLENLGIFLGSLENFMSFLEVCNFIARGGNQP